MAATSGMPPLPPEVRQQLQQRLEAVQHLQQYPQVQQLSQKWNDFIRQFDSLPSGISVQDALFLVFRESIAEANIDKKYYLQRLQQFNAIEKALSGELSVLNAVREKARGFRAAPGTSQWPAEPG